MKIILAEYHQHSEICPFFFAIRKKNNENVCNLLKILILQTNDCLQIALFHSNRFHFFCFFRFENGPCPDAFERRRNQWYFLNSKKKRKSGLAQFWSRSLEKNFRSIRFGQIENSDDQSRHF